MVKGLDRKRLPTPSMPYNADNMNTPSASPKKSITDSPWYWVYLFCTGAAVALVLAGPKLVALQSQLERNSEARLHAARQVATQQINGSEQEFSQQTANRITLWPLYVVLGIVLTVAWFNLWRRHKRGRAAVESSPPSEAPA